jgi:hypothetical protein
MPKLPRASGDKHVAAFKRAGWVVNHIEGSHYILIKGGSDVHLSINTGAQGQNARYGSFEETYRQSRSHK